MKLPRRDSDAKRMTSDSPLDAFVPEAFWDLKDPLRDLPRLAKNPSAMAMIEAAECKAPTKHEVFLGDARNSDLSFGSVHLVLTSPPYWTLKEYRRYEGQLGWVEDYNEFLDQFSVINATED